MLNYIRNWPCRHGVDSTGTGYMTACLAQLTGPTGHVLALEKQPKLVERARASIKASLPDVCADVDVQVCNVMAGGRDCMLDDVAWGDVQGPLVLICDSSGGHRGLTTLA